MSVAGFYNPRDNIHVLHVPAVLIATLEIGRLQLLSRYPNGHVEIAAEEFNPYRYKPPIRGLQGDPIQTVYRQYGSIEQLYDWGGRKLHWHLIEDVWSAPSRDTTSRFRYFEFRLEPIPEV